MSKSAYVLSLKPLLAHHLNPSVVQMLNQTSRKLVNRSLWSLPLLRRMFFRSAEIGVDPLLYLCTSTRRTTGETFQVLLVNYRDIVTGNPNSYGWDLAGRWLFYDVDPLNTPPFQALNRWINKTSTVSQVPYLTLDVKGFSAHRPESEIREFVKSLKGNFTPHVFGAKSDLYTVDHIQGLAATHMLTEAIMCFGIQRAGRFLAEGQHDVMPELYDLPMQLAGLARVHHQTVHTVSLVASKTSCPLGTLSFYTTRPVLAEDHQVVYLHEVLVDPDVQHKHLSLVPLLHVHALIKIKKLYPSATVLFGYNLAEGYSRYKDIFRAEERHFNLYTDQHVAPGVLPLEILEAEDVLPA